MRVLKSALMVVSAGLSTVLLAVAARAGLDVAGFKTARLPEALIPAISFVIVLWCFSLFRGYRPWRRRPFRIMFHHMAIPWTLAIACQTALSIFVYPAFGEAERWCTHVSLGGFLTAGFMATFEWAAHDAAKPDGPE